MRRALELEVGRPASAEVAERLRALDFSGYALGGLSVGESPAEVPQATQRALVRSIVGLFVISTVVSFLTYL